MPTASEEYELRDTFRRVGVPEEDIDAVIRNYERIRQFFFDIWDAPKDDP